MVTHIVFWNFRPDVDVDETVRKIQGIFAAFTGNVPGLLSLTVHKGFAGYHACLISHHEDRAALEVYANHPDHAKAKEYVHSVRIERASCDFED